ncbi:MAG: permease-like cell division protein FtsX [Pseudomonadota bacterium]
MQLYFRKAVRDILDNGFLNAVTIFTIAMAVLVIGAFALFILNTSILMQSWKKGVRIMAYIQADTDPATLGDVQKQIEALYGVKAVAFISKAEALQRLKSQMKRQSALFDNLEDNPLPDAFEVRMADTPQDVEKVEELARNLARISAVSDVEYGQRWIGRFSNIIRLFTLMAYALGALFFIAAVFFVANTIRLVIYSRREEIEIMRLVGAEDVFIKTPFYIEAMLQGLIGGVIGIAALFVSHVAISLKVADTTMPAVVALQFLPAAAFAVILATSVAVGWMGCFLSLKQYLRR